MRAHLGRLVLHTSRIGRPATTLIVGRGRRSPRANEMPQTVPVPVTIFYGVTSDAARGVNLQTGLYEFWTDADEHV
jgi:hypothetical protein